MAATSRQRRGPRGSIVWLPSGSARVSVYGGVDQLTGKQIRLRETVTARASRRETEREALRVQTRLLNQVDERRSPKTEASVSLLLDRWLEVIDVERKTRVGYVGKIEKHVRPSTSGTRAEVLRCPRRYRRALQPRQRRGLATHARPTVEPSSLGRGQLVSYVARWSLRCGSPGT